MTDLLSVRRRPWLTQRDSVAATRRYHRRATAVSTTLASGSRRTGRGPSSPRAQGLDSRANSRRDRRRGARSRRRIPLRARSGAARVMQTTQVLEYTPGVVPGDDPLHGELMHLNVGPQHPATHGVLRLKITLD